jgi:hypothetical protein
LRLRQGRYSRCRRQDRSLSRPGAGRRLAYLWLARMEGVVPKPSLISLQAPADRPWPRRYHAAQAPAALSNGRYCRQPDVGGLDPYDITEWMFSAPNANRADHARAAQARVTGFWDRRWRFAGRASAGRWWRLAMARRHQRQRDVADQSGIRTGCGEGEPDARCHVNNPRTKLERAHPDRVELGGGERTRRWDRCLEP